MNGSRCAWLGVRAKVLAVDAEAGRLSLGLKPSYFAGEDEDMDGAASAPGAALGEGRGRGGEDEDLDAQMLDAVGGSEEEEDGVDDGALGGGHSAG